MGILVVGEWMSLDGVVQAPMLADEDRDGEFAHGGWHAPYLDDIARDWITDGLNRASAFLLGHRTFENFAAYWQTAPESERAVSQPLNERKKYVVSKTLTDPEWHPTVVLSGEARADVRRAIDETPGELHLIGSAVLAAHLIEHDLVDRYRLMIDPIILGAGKRIYPLADAVRPLRLDECIHTSTGSMLVTYSRG